MRRQRYRNEALYPYNGPAAIKRWRGRRQSKRRESTIMRRPVQLKMQLNTE